MLVVGQSIQLAGECRMPDGTRHYSNTWATVQTLPVEPATIDSPVALYQCRTHDGSLHLLPRSAFTTIVQARVIEEPGDGHGDAVMSDKSSGYDTNEDQETDEIDYDSSPILKRRKAPFQIGTRVLVKDRHVHGCVIGGAHGYHCILTDSGAQAWFRAFQLQASQQ